MAVGPREALQLHVRERESADRMETALDEYLKTVCHPTYTHYVIPVWTMRRWFPASTLSPRVLEEVVFRYRTKKADPWPQAYLDRETGAIVLGALPVEIDRLLKEWRVCEETDGFWPEGTLDAQIEYYNSRWKDVEPTG